MLKWILLVSVVIGLGFFYWFYVNVSTGLPVATTPSQNDGIQTVTLIYQHQDNIHRFFGEVVLPNSCNVLTHTESETAGTPTVLEIHMMSQDRSQTSSTCANYPTRYPFDITHESGYATLAPKLFLNGTELHVNVSERPWGGAAGTLLNPSLGL